MTSSIISFVWRMVPMFLFPMYPLTRKFEDDVQIVRTFRTCLLSGQKVMYRLLHTFVDPEFTAIDSDALELMTVHDLIEPSNGGTPHADVHTHYEAHTNAVSLTGEKNLSTRTVQYPTSDEEIKMLLKCAYDNTHKIKVVGTNHSWNSDHTPSVGAQVIVMSNYTNVSQTTSSGVVIVGSGSTCSNLQTQVARDGWYLPSIPEYARMTVGGTVATNSHGCSAKHLPMSTHVLRMHVIYVDHDGHPRQEWVDTSGETDQARAFRSHMGKLGIITELAIQLSPLTYHIRNLRVVNLETFKQEYGTLLVDPAFALARIEPISGVVTVESFGEGQDTPGRPHADREEMWETAQFRTTSAAVFCQGDTFMVWYLALLRLHSPWVLSIMAGIMSYLPICRALTAMHWLSCQYTALALFTSGVASDSATYSVLMTWFTGRHYVDPGHGVPAHLAQSDYYFYHGYCDHSLQTEFNFDPTYRGDMVDVWREAAILFPGRVVPCVLRVFKNDYQHTLLSHGTHPTSRVVMSMYCPVKNTDDAEEVFSHIIQELDRRGVVFAVHGGKYIPLEMRGPDDDDGFVRNVSFESRYHILGSYRCKYDFHGLFAKPGWKHGPHACPASGHKVCGCHDDGPLKVTARAQAPN